MSSSSSSGGSFQVSRASSALNPPFPPPLGNLVRNDLHCKCSSCHDGVLSLQTSLTLLVLLDGTMRTQTVDPVVAVLVPVVVENWRCAEHGQKVSTVTAGRITLGVAAEPGSSQTNPWPTQTSFEQCTNAFSCARTHKQNVPSYAKVLVSVASPTFCECTATRACRRNELPKSSMKLAKSPFQDSQRTAWYKPHSARASPELDARHCRLESTHGSQTAHPGDDTGRSHSWPSAATAPRSSAKSSHLFETLGDGDRATAKLHVKKAAQAADEAWWQTVDGHNGLALRNRQCQNSNIPVRILKMMTAKIWFFSSAPRKSRPSAPQLRTQLSRLSERTRLRQQCVPQKGSTTWTHARRVS